jgi:hypothetical protein
MISDRVQRVRILELATRRPLHFGEVVQLWQQKDFATFFSGVLSASPFEAYFWETPPVSEALIESTVYEHVTVNNPRGFAPASPDAFSEHLSACTSGGATAFENLGGDAVLIVPCKRTDDAHYGSIAAVVRGAPASQLVEFWALVGTALRRTLHARGHAFTWMSTEGSGVPWVHVRLDSRPKYYHHRAYRTTPDTGSARRGD